MELTTQDILSTVLLSRFVNFFHTSGIYSFILFVLAHELGHALYHSSSTAFFLHDHTFYKRGKFEIEANIFAAGLLINERELDKHILQDMSIDQLSCYFEVPKELVEYKFRKKSELDKAIHTLEDILKGISIDKDIKEELNKLRNELSIDGICAVCPTISLNDKIFCFTGTSSKTTRKEQSRFPFITML